MLRFRQTSIKPRKSPSQERSSALVDAILEAAIRVLLRDGYARLTTTSVVEVAGVSVGSLYQYFPNKQAILAEVIRLRADQILAQLGSIDVAPGDRADEVAAKMIAAFLNEKRRMASLSLALKEPMAEVDGRSIIRESLHKVHGAIAGLLSRSICRPLTDLENRRLMVAMAAVEGAVSSAMELDSDLLLSQEFEVTLVRLFNAAVDLPDADVLP